MGCFWDGVESVVPGGLWKLVDPLIPLLKERPQGGGTQGAPAETLFAAIVYVVARQRVPGGLCHRASESPSPRPIAGS